MGHMQARNRHVAAQPWTELDRLTTAELRQKWLDCFGGDSAPKLKRELLVGALAYSLQAQTCGGLKPRTRRKLHLLAANPEAPIDKRPALAPGTRLVREWQGTTHVVEVGPDGFFWQGQKCTSLSAIAREITGTRWSGPRFFGLDNAPTGAAR